MTKKRATQFVFLVAMLFLISACASRDEVLTDSSSQPAAIVPGEKVSGEGALAPGAGPGGANANVRW